MLATTWWDRSLDHVVLGVWWHLSLNDLLVGGGTLALAVVAGWQVVLQRRQTVMAARPTVVPAPSPEWTRKLPPYDGDKWAYVLPVANLGPGSALNVSGELRFASPQDGSPQRVVFFPTNIAAGTTADLALDWNRGPRTAWYGGTGELRYEDNRGRHLQTTFAVDTTGLRMLVTLHVTSISD
jgi:hypothetical protein